MLVIRAICRLSLAAAMFWAASAHADDPVPTPSASQPGAPLYSERCAQCHDHPTGRIPPRTLLTIVKTPDQVIKALTQGVMREQAAGLTADQIAALAVFITGKQPGTNTDPDPNANRCKAGAHTMKPGADDWSGWGRDPYNTRYQADAGLTAADVPRLKVKWVFAYPGNLADGQPVVAGGRLFVANRAGRVFALDAKTGCTWWSYDAEGGVHAAISVGAVSGAPAAFVTSENGYVHALDADTGKVLWTTRAEDHPATRLTGSPTLYQGVLYVPLSSLEEVSLFNPGYACCTFRGGVVAVDTSTGKMLWTSHTIEQEPKKIGVSASGADLFGPAGAAIFSAPTIDPKRRVLYVGTGNSYTQTPPATANAAMAFDLDTGKRRWATQVMANDNICPASQKAAECAHTGPDFDFASPPVLARSAGGKDVLVAVSKAHEAFGFDPDQDGKLLWRTKLGQGSRTAGNWGIAVADGRLYVGSADVKPAPGVEIGGLTAIDAATGKIVWHVKAPPPACGWGDTTNALAAANGAVVCTQAQPGAIAVIPGVVFSGSVDGHMRAYSAKDGAVLWEFDTGRSFPAVNAATATGGSISNGAEAVANGVLYVNSGSAGVHQPGNALLAFTVDGN
jgi:polyvinyl alcohol dehydrogenase (cytochrome)